MRAKLATTECLHAAGIAMMRQRLLREHPGRPDLAEQALLRWLRREDEPIPGDVAGSVHVAPRTP